MIYMEFLLELFPSGSTSNFSLPHMLIVEPGVSGSTWHMRALRDYNFLFHAWSCEQRVQGFWTALGTRLLQ